jgi:hypothetical protein
MPSTPQQGGTHMPGTPGTQTPAAPSTPKNAKDLNLLLRAWAQILNVLKNNPLQGLQPMIVPLSEEQLRCLTAPGADIERCLEDSGC